MSGRMGVGVLQTIAASLIAFVVVFITFFLVVEHFVVFKKRKEAIKSKTKQTFPARGNSKMMRKN